MIILLGIYFIFLIAYIAFNIYAILKVWSMRLENDQTQLILLVYMVVICVIVFISVGLISSLNWSTNFNLR